MQTQPSISHNSQTLESALVEYQATQDTVLHYDNFTWHVGAVLLAGVFVFWGFLLDKQPGAGQVAVGITLLNLILAAWQAYASHNRQIYKYKVHRLQELEAMLKMQQHTRFGAVGGSSPAYPLTRVRGNLTERFIYVVGSMGSLLLSFSAIPWNAWAKWHLVLLASNVVVVIATNHIAKLIGADTERALAAFKRPLE
jgi:hypothetical protein